MGSKQSQNAVSTPVAYQFGPFEADLRKSELRREGIRLRLERKPWQLLLALLERPGELITRAELEKRLWGEGVFVDFEHGINVAAKKVRQVLCDTPEEPRYLQTVPGQGYRFVAAVTPMFASSPVVEAASPAAQAPPQRVMPQPAPAPQRWWAFGVAIASAMTSVALVLLIAARSAPPPQPTAERLTTSDVITGAISPDGSYLAYSTKDALWLQNLRSGEVHQLDTQPKLSPWHIAWYSDSSAFLATTLDGVWRVPTMGGMALRVYGLAGQASPSPDGAHITLKTFGSGDDIWVTDANGGDARIVAKRQPGETLSRAVWSPHGQRLAFIRKWAEPNSPHGTAAELRTMLADGGDVHVVVTQLSLVQLAWLADGRVVFSVDAGDPKNKISAVNLWAVAISENTGLATSHPEPLTNWPDFNFTLPSATADARTIAFVRDRSYTNLYVADLAPGATSIGRLRQLTSDTAILFNSPSAWDPATNDLLYSVSAPTKKSVILRRAMDGTPARSAVPPSEFDQTDAQFSADGRWMLWLRLSAQRNVAEVLSMPREGGPVTVLDRQPGSQFGLSCPARLGADCVFSARQKNETVYRSVSPDSHSNREMFRSSIMTTFEAAPGGDQVLTCAPAPDGEDRFFLVDSSGINRTELPFACDATEWTSLPNGSGWLVTRPVKGRNETEVIRLDRSGATKLLLRSDRWLGSPLVSSDERHVAFSSGDRERNIWALHF